MATLEFGSVYKFGASAGVALWAGAAVVAWAALQENHLVELSRSDLSELPSTSRSTLRAQQGLLHQFVTWWWALSLGLFVVGLVLLVVSLVLWFRRQGVTDETEDEQLRQIKASARPATEAETEAEQHAEATEALADASLLVETGGETRQPRSLLQISTDYRAVEDNVARQVFAALSSGYLVGRNVAVSRTTPDGAPSRRVAIVDLLATPLNSDSPSLVFEIKYSATRVVRARVDQAVEQAANLAELYQEAKNLPTRAVVIFVSAEESPARWTSGAGADKDVRVVALSDHELSNIDPAELRRRICG